MEDKILVLRGKVNEELEIDEIYNDLETLHKEVNGYIEVVMLENDIMMIINEEGHLLGLEPNIALRRNGQFIDVIVGDVIIAGLDRETGDTIGLTKQQLDFLCRKFLYADFDGTMLKVYDY